MLRTALRTASALVLVTALTIPALAAAPPGAIRAKSLLGSTINLQGGTKVGTVQDIVLSQDGTVDYLIVGEGGKLVTVPWQAAKFNYEKRTATVNLTPDQFKQIPTYTPSNYPQFYSPAYQTQIYRYYNLPPGRARRLERRQGRP
jgi:sporulation protein YlmC with PRC-barrel domain